MKNSLLITLFTILTVTAVKSQEKIQIGIKGGINFTNLTSDVLYDKKFKTGFHIGTMVEIPLGNFFSLQTEILYATQGAKGKVPVVNFPLPGDPTPPPVFGEYKLDYIQIPILAKIYFIKNFSLEIGPSFNFLTRDEESNIFDDNTTKRKGFGKKYEFSGVIGTSYKFKNGLFGSARYVHGMTDAFDYEGANNISFQIGIGYLF